jgi:hypothetical protein
MLDLVPVDDTNHSSFTEIDGKTTMNSYTYTRTYMLSSFTVQEKTTAPNDENDEEWHSGLIFSFLIDAY